MKKYISLLLICYFINPTFAAISSFHPHNRNFYPHRYYNNNYNVLPQHNLNALEKYALNKVFSRDSDINRLERLEELTFGSIQNGDIRTRYKNVESAILSRPRNNYQQPLRNNIHNYFTGQPTGITPTLQQFFSENPSYNNTRIDQFNNGLWGNGYRIRTNGYSSGSGIRILD